MILLYAFYLILTVYLLGTSLTLWLGKKNILEVMGLGFLFGSLVLTFSEILLQQYWQSNITRELVINFSHISLVFSLFSMWKFSSVFLPLQLPKYSLSSWEKIIVILLFLIVSFTILQNLFWPITDWDALALYDFRARVVAETGNFLNGFDLGYFFQYPPYTSLLHTSLYVLGFNRVKIWYTLIYGSFLSIFYVLLRRHTSRILSLLGTLLLAVNPLIFEHSIMAYTNLSYTVFFSLGILYLLEWMENNSWTELLLGSFLIGGSSWIRASEPFWLVGLIIICSKIFFLWKEKKLNMIQTLISFTSIVIIVRSRIVWTSFLQSIAQTSQIVEDTQSTQSTSWYNHIPVISQIFEFRYYLIILLNQKSNNMVKHLYDVSAYFLKNIIPIISIYFAPSIYVCLSVIKKREFFLIFRWTILLIFLLMIFVGIFIFSFTFETWDGIGGSASRMSMFLIPLFVFEIFNGLGKVIKR